MGCEVVATANIVVALGVASYALSLGHEIADSVIGGSPLAVGIGYLMNARRRETPDS